MPPSANTATSTANNEVNKAGRSQPWKNFIKTDDDAEAPRTSDFITVRTIKGQDGEEVHDYTAQLG